MASSKIVTETKRLLLRHFTLEDAGDLAILQADPVVMKFLRLRNYEETLKTLDWIFNCSPVKVKLIKAESYTR
ncbi:MAG: GNAT family N-acetyltransferase [Xenococcaceae cyanobacterium]